MRPVRSPIEAASEYKRPDGLNVAITDADESPSLRTNP